MYKHRKYVRQHRIIQFVHKKNNIISIQITNLQDTEYQYNGKGKG